MTVMTRVSGMTHPWRPRGSQSGREKRRHESFQVRAEEPHSHRTISKDSSGCQLLIGHKKCFVLLCPISEHISWVPFVRLYTKAIVSIMACLAHVPKKCRQSGNFHFDIKSPSDFKILSARKLKTLFQKYKLQLTTCIHACISHVLHEYIYRKILKDTMTADSHENIAQKSEFIFLSVSIVIIPTHLLCRMQANLSGAEFLSTISEFMKRMNFVIACLRPLQNVKLGIFTGSRAIDGKEMYKKAWCTCKVVVLPCQAIAYLTFCCRQILNFLLFKIHCDPSKTIFSRQIELLLPIASQTFLRLISSSFVSGKESRKQKFPLHAQAWCTNRANVARQ